MKQFTFLYRTREIKIRSNQVNSANLRTYFRVESNFFLKENGGDRIEFSNINGEFELNDYNDRSIFSLVDNDESATGGARPSVSPSSTTGNASQQGVTLRASSTPLRRHCLTAVKVVRADIGSNGKPCNFHFHQSTAHINIYNEEQACVDYITSKIRSEMGDETLVLVGPNGLLYFDQDGTRGVSFWKVGSRKLFAVEAVAVEHHRDAENDEDINTSTPLAKRKRPNEISLERKIDELNEEIKSMKKEIGKFHNLAFRYKFSASLLSELEESFSCLICKRAPARKPLIGCTECSSVIGCQRCVNEWYSGANSLNKKCPKCRVDRGLSKSIILRGFDGLLTQIRNLRESSSSESEESDGALDDTVPIVQ